MQQERQTRAHTYTHQSALLWPILILIRVGHIRTVAHSICKKKTPHHHLSTPPPCCFPVEWNNLPPSGNPVWVRGPTFSLLLIVCLEEDVKHTIRHRWLSLPGNVLIQTRWRAAPFSGFVSQMPPLSWSLYVTGLYLLDHVTSCGGLKRDKQIDHV